MRRTCYPALAMALRLAAAIALPLVLLALGPTGCRTFDPQHPAVGEPNAVGGGKSGYWVWFKDSMWHVRMATGASPTRRFQGSVAGTRGGVAELILSRPALKDTVAIGGDAVQFDVELTAAD